MDALRAYEKRTGKPPRAFLDKPKDISPDASFYLGAFNFLSRFRGSNGFALEPIRYSDVAHYADQIGGLDGDEFFFFAEVISELDREYRRMSAEKDSKRPVPNPGSAK